MATRFDHPIPLLPGNTCHIFKRGNAQDFIFLPRKKLQLFSEKKRMTYCLFSTQRNDIENKSGGFSQQVFNREIQIEA